MLVGALLIRRILPYIARRTQTDLDDRLLDKIGPDLRGLVVVLALQFATERLTFVRAGVKDILDDAYFLVGLVIIMRAGWRLIDLVGQWYGERSRLAGRKEELTPFITLLARIFRALLLVTGLIILLSHFGASTTAFSVALALGGLAISLAARDTVADAIAGFIILVDRPFRMGDRIEIQGEGTWGDVVEIGLRTTRIRTRDNRMVIVPNSLISQNQVINYTYPDPRYRIETTVGIAYGTDIEVVERLIKDAVRQVPGVLSEESVEVLYDKMGDWAMTLCIRWWIESYIDAKRMHDQVHRVLQKTLDAAGIEMPYPTQTLHLRNDLNDEEIEDVHMLTVSCPKWIKKTRAHPSLAAQIPARLAARRPGRRRHDGRRRHPTSNGICRYRWSADQGGVVRGTGADARLCYPGHLTPVKRQRYVDNRHTHRSRDGPRGRHR